MRPPILKFQTFFYLKIKEKKVIFKILKLFFEFNSKLKFFFKYLSFAIIFLIILVFVKQIESKVGSIFRSKTLTKKKIYIQFRKKKK